MRMAVLDVGSNTVHLLVVDAHSGAAPVPTSSVKHELRLAEHLRADGSIDREATDELVCHIVDAVAMAEDLGCKEFLGFATSAIREAKNGEAVLKRISDETGVRLQVLSGSDEARLTFLAVRRWFGWSSRHLLVLDIGGGSLEIASGTDEGPDAAISLPLGAGRLASTFIESDPVAREELKALRKHARATIADIVSEVLRVGVPDHAVATSKTFRSLARLTGAAAASDGPYVPRMLELGALNSLVIELAAMTFEERKALPGVSAGRARQIVAGAVVAEAAMELLELEAVEICPWALREGVILRRLDQMALSR